MKKWKLSDSWDSIIERLLELENTELSFPNISILRDNDRWIEEPNEKPKAFFAFNLEKYYTSLQIHFCSCGHAFWNDGCIFSISADPDKPSSKNNAANLKEAAVKMLNFWEQFLIQGELHVVYKKFRQWVDGLITQK